MNSIYISDQGELLLIDAPEKPAFSALELLSPAVDTDRAIINYKAALASAIAKGVKFKDQEVVKAVIAENCTNKEWDYIKDRLKADLFPLPTGYKVSFEYQVREDESGIWSEVSKSIYNTLKGFQKQMVAILSKLEEEKKEDSQDVFTIDRKYEGDQCITTVYKNGELVKQERKPLETWEVRCVAPSEEVKLERKKIELGEIFEVDGKCYAFSCPRTAIERPTTNHGHILHEIDFIR